MKSTIYIYRVWGGSIARKAPMRNVCPIIIFMIISLTLVSMTSCSKTAEAVKEDNGALSNTASQISFSPDGRYRAEAYGRITELRQVGFFPMKEFAY